MRKGNSFFRKPTRPSLPLRKAPPLTPTLSPSGKREETAPPRRSEPLRSKVGGALKPSPWLCGMGPPSCYGDQLAIILLKVSAWRGLAD